MDSDTAPGDAAGVHDPLGGTYLVLGVLGWFVNGLFLGAAYQIPLGAADNVFHHLLAAGAGYTVIRTELPRWRAYTP